MILNERRDLAEILESIVTPAASRRRRRWGLEESVHRKQGIKSYRFRDVIITSTIGLVRQKQGHAAI